VVSLLNTDHNPINLRFRTSLDWSRGRVDASIAANYTNHYRDVDSSPVHRIGSFTTYDWLLKYSIGERKSSGALEVSAGIQNVMDRQPPFLRNVAGDVGYDQENADPQGRVWFVNLSYRL
jgi:outer membrane receptor protein involved in Fe transport